MKKALTLITALLTVFITAPIWYFLLYSILKAINPDRLLWFLFWIYLPTGILVSIIEKIAKLDD